MIRTRIENSDRGDVLCPVCQSISIQIGDAMPAYLRQYGICGGLSERLMFQCASEMCGILFGRLIAKVNAPET